MTPLTLLGSRKSDPQAVKQWAAEDLAITFGLLRECPFHGQPFKAKRAPLSLKAIPVGLIDPLDPAVRVFNGNTRELVAAVENATGRYGERCEFCAASEEELLD